MTCRRHCLLLLFLALLPLSGATCLEDNQNVEELQRCQDLCNLEAQCPGLRTAEDCIDQMCDNDDGFKIVGNGDDEIDLATLTIHDCIEKAEDCSELVRCTCEDSCLKIDECTGGADAETCEDDCEVLVEQAPEQEYLENRCELESTCEDLPVCGGAGG